MLVVSIQIRERQTGATWIKKSLQGMHYVFAYSTSATMVRHRVRTLARHLNVRMLIIDEIHSVLADTSGEQRMMLNAIVLSTMISASLVYVGTREAKQALMTDQQLADRFEAAELPAWENDSTF